MSDSQLDSLFLRALDLEGEARAKFLAEQEPAVRRELEAWLKAKAELDDRDLPGDGDPDSPIGAPGRRDMELATTPFNPEWDKAVELEFQSSGHPVAPGEDHETPDVIGRYRIQRELDRGSQGIVYVATDPESGDEVVLKVSRHVYDTEFRRSLSEEAACLASLDHPGLGKLIRLEFDQGRPIVVLEYIRGRSLKQRLDDERFGPEKACGIVARLAIAIHYAHDRGVIHQDLKPANIVFDGDAPKIIDFGLARERSAYFVTPDHEAIGGTPSYIAPEQARNYLAYLRGDELQPVNHQADIFGLGAILYQMLTGKAPFDAGDALDTLRLAAEGKFEESLLDAHSIPRPIRDACLTAMQCDLAKRYETAKQFADALRPVDAPGPAGDGPPPARMQVLPVIVGGCLVLAAAALGWQFRGASWRNEPLERPMPPHAASPATVEDSIPAGAIKVPFGWISFTHIAVNDGKSDPQLLFTNGNPQELDQLRIEVAFAQPSYAFLFALNPDGEIQSCFPELGDESMPQDEPITRLIYPADRTKGFAFTDGLGQQAFFVVCSANPLGSFADWWQENEDIQWPPKSDGGRWCWQAGELQEILRLGQTRGVPREIPGIQQFVEAGKRWEAAPGELNVFGIMFPVERRATPGTDFEIPPANLQGP